MKKIFTCRILIFLCTLIVCNACNGVSKSGNKLVPDNYKTAIVLYPRVDGPWVAPGFYSVPPESFTQDVGYRNHINQLKITDTTFINRLTESINYRNTLKDSKSFDTWFMVLLANRNDSLVDTLAVCHNIMWFNREIYIDSTVAGIITDEIIRHDKDFAMSVNDYYDNGQWYPYLGKELTNILLKNSNN